MAATRKSKAARKSPAPAKTGLTEAAAAGFSLGELRRLIRLVQRTGIGELELSSGGRSIRISAQGVSGAPMMLPAMGMPAPPPPARDGAAPPAAAAAAPAAAASQRAITSPMVGTFYRAPAPDADPYVETGDLVEVGQTVCIIEAMKLMNEIEADFKGRVVQVLVENAQPVEFGQKLFLVEPA
jgi:acetyl-CoA carboxylase biotin carboxyl carrier protein